MFILPFYKKSINNPSGIGKIKQLTRWTLGKRYDVDKWWCQRWSENNKRGRKSDQRGRKSD
jgi:hypothetical protein